MRRYVAVVAVLLALTGCVRTLHPLYTQKDLAFDPALLGAWELENSDRQERWDFRKAGDKKYILLHTDDSGRKARLTVRLVEVEGHRFLDLRPQKQKKMNNLLRLHLHPVHTFLRVKSIEPLRFAAMSPSWLREHLKQNPDALEYVNPEDLPPVVTAGTEKLQEFVLAHLNTEGAWGDIVKFRRIDQQEKDGDHGGT